jgi:hypothetical protein
MIILRFERRVCRWESCRMHQFYAALVQLQRDAPLRTERLGVEIPHAAPIGLSRDRTLRVSARRSAGWRFDRRLSRPERQHHFAHVVQRRDGALKTRTVSVQIRPWAPTACSPMQRRSAQTGKVAGASPATRTSFVLPSFGRPANLECPPDKRAGPVC